MSSSGTSTSSTQSPSVAATCKSSVPISTGRPIRFFLASQVVMMPSCGERMFIDSICSSMISIRSLRALGRDLRLGLLGLKLDPLLVVLADAALLIWISSVSCLGLGLRLVGDQPLQLLLQLVAVELGHDVVLVDAVAVIDQDLD